MDQQTLQIVVNIAAVIALLIQAGMLIGIFMVAKRTGDKLTALMPEIHKVLEKSEAALSETRDTVKDVAVKTNAILDGTRVQLVKVEDLLNDASSRARVQMDRAEMLLDDTVSKAQNTVNIVYRGIVSPIREVHGVLSGLRAAMGYLGQHRRTKLEQITADEEMFI